MFFYIERKTKKGGELKWLAKTISLKWEPKTYSEGMVMIYAFLKYSLFVTMEAIFFIFYFLVYASYRA